MAKVLITGADGQLGRECAAAFGACAAGADLPRTDIADAEAVRAAFAECGPDLETVVNCAAYTAVDKAETERALCEKANALAPGVLGAACRERGVFLIHISTDYVFDGARPAPQPWLESDAPAPRCWYGETKLRGERAAAESGCRCAVLRTAWLYGAHGENFPKTMLRLALSGKPLRVVSDQFGCPTCAADLARQIKAVAENRDALAAAHGAGAVFHATSSGWTTWHGFAAEFLRLMGAGREIEAVAAADFPAAARRPANSILDASRLRAAGLYMMPDWREALSRFAAANRGALTDGARAAAT